MQTHNGSRANGQVRTAGDPSGVRRFCGRVFLHKTHGSEGKHAPASCRPGGLADTFASIQPMHGSSTSTLAWGRYYEPPPIGARVQILEWWGWAGHLAGGIETILRGFICNLAGHRLIPQLSLLMTNLGVNQGGLGVLEPSHRAAPNFVLTMAAGKTVDAAWFHDCQRRCNSPAPPNDHGAIRPTQSSSTDLRTSFCT